MGAPPPTCSVMSVLAVQPKVYVSARRGRSAQDCWIALPDSAGWSVYWTRSEPSQSGGGCRTNRAGSPGSRRAGGDAERLVR